MDTENNLSYIERVSQTSPKPFDVKNNKYASPDLMQQPQSWKNPINFKKRSSSKKKAKEEALNLYHALDIYDSETVGANKVVDRSSCPSDLNAPSLSSSSSGAARSPPVSSFSFPLEFISECANPSTANGNQKSKRKSANNRILTRHSSIRRYPEPYSNSIEDTFHSTSSPSFTAHSPPVSRQSSVNIYSSLSRSFSVTSSHNNIEENRAPRRKRRIKFFGTKGFDFFSSSMSSAQSPVRNDVTIPSPARFAAMYHAVRKGVSEHISVNTAELNVLQVRKTEATRLNAAQSYDSDKLIKHLERVIKKLQYQQIQLDEVHEAYVMQQRYREGAYKLKSALSSSKSRSKASFVGIKSDIVRCTETLCALEQDLTGLLGKFHIDMNGLLGFARLRAGDQYEIVMRYGQQKWRAKGTVKSSVDQAWDNTQRTLQPLLTDLINIKVMEVKVLGHLTTVGNVFCETKDLFQVEPQDLIVDLNDTATLKLSLRIKWSPYDGYEAPPSVNSGKSSFSAPPMRQRTRSAIERPRPISAQFNPRTRLLTGCSRPLSVIYSSSNLNNSSNNGPLQIPHCVSTGNKLTGCNSIDSCESSNEKTTNESQKSNLPTPSTQENDQGSKSHSDPHEASIVGLS